LAAEPYNKTMFQQFLHSQVFGALVLIATTAIALFWANSQWGQLYSDISHTYVGIKFGATEFKMSLSHWIKDGLMAVFFFVVGLEIKREILVGELSSPEKALLPVLAAIGGAIVPALVYVGFNLDGGSLSGWGIPMATDIAFALGILAMFGKRVPLELKIFLTALAIADDLIAVAAIALFYTPNLSIGTLLLSSVPLGLMIWMNRAGVRATWVYSVLAFLVWVSVLLSGVHATIAGVLVALVVPVRPSIDPARFIKTTSDLLEEIDGPDNSLDALIHDSRRRNKLNELSLTVEDAIPPGIALEHSLHPLIAFIVLPLFALFSAGVDFDANVSGGPLSPVSVGIVAGLVFGKPVGIMLTSWLVVRIGKVDLGKLTMPMLLGASCLAGIGFTMSIFISELAFASDALIYQAKIGVLAASIAAGILGALVLHLTLPGKGNH
jgi:NhaA family Na+:H+ antiporter